jgi:hypothetical protein
MRFPLTVSDLGLWLAVTAVILILTSELLFSSPKYSAYFKVEKNRLRYAALGCGLAFLVTVVLRAFQPV